MSAMVEVVDLHFAYGTRSVLRGVHLRAERGEMVGVIGPNGAGKSTLLGLMGGVLRPASGVVKIAGRPAGEYSRAELARRVAAVTQSASVDFPFSVIEVVLMGRAPHLGGRMFESARDLAVAEEAMRRTRVRDLACRSVHHLSGGERQRVILARALAQEAPVLLLDEPTAFLDIRHQIEICDVLSDLRRAGYAIIAALHDLNLASLYCNRLVLLHGGGVLAAGVPEAVLTPANLRAAYETEVRVQRDTAWGAVSVLPGRRVQRQQGN